MNAHRRLAQGGAEPSPGRQVCEGAFSFSRQTGRHKGAAPFFFAGVAA